MNEKYKKRIPKVLPVGIAMGILFSASPIASPLTENKVKADVDTFATIVTTFGSIYDAFIKEPFGKWLEELDAKNYYRADHENLAYKAPTFQKGEFGISVFDYYKDKNFSKKVKLVYPNGKVEYKTIKHGEQIRIKQAGTIVDLTPDELELSKHDILYITQKQLDEGKTGVALATFKTYYLQSDNSGRRNNLADKYLRETFPNAYLKSGLPDVRVDENELFKKLPEEKRMLGTITSEPVGKEVLSNYVTNDSKALADFNERVENVFADTKLTLETPLASPYGLINGGASYQIIPYKKGTNKVFVKTGSKYLSGKEGNKLQYSDSIGDEELFELVQIQPDPHSNKFQFHLLNKNGVPLTRNLYLESFDQPASGSDDINFYAKNNNEIHNWLREWYPGKENEKQKHDELQIVTDEKDPNKWTAKDSSGNVIKNSWVNPYSDSDFYFYAGSDGVFLKGWHDIEGKTYYFSPDNSGVVKRGSFNSHIDGKYYHFDEKGALQRSTWSDDNYSDASGAFIEKGLQEIDGKIYYFQNYNANKNEIRLEDQNMILHFSDKGVLEKASRLNGEALNSVNHVTFNEKTLVFEKDGSIRKSGVSKIFLPGLNLEGKEQPALVYYSLEEGPNYYGWKEINGKKYYFMSGIHYTFDGNETIDGKKYYFNQEGQALPTGFVDIDGIPYYLDDKSEKVTGVHKIDDKLYLFSQGDNRRAYGEKVRNTIYKFDGKRYYTDHTGVISQNFKGYVYSHDSEFHIETNNEGVITNIWER